jgi:hypothetical protein
MLVVINAVSSSIVGFGQIGAYLDVSRAVASAMLDHGYTVASLIVHAGAGRGVATVVAAVVAGAVAAGCVVLGRRGDDRRSLLVCVALIVLATPVLWLHYFALLLVPLAIARPRLSAAWFVPLLLWPCPDGLPVTWQIATGLVVLLAVPAMIWREGSESLRIAAAAGADRALRATGTRLVDLRMAPDQPRSAHPIRLPSRTDGQMGPSASPKVDLRDS